MSRTIERVSTGVEGLDEVLYGGFIAGRSYMLDGSPGAGETVLALELLDAAGPEEAALFVDLEEDLDDLRTDAGALGFDVDALDRSPQEFAQAVRREVETHDTSIVMIDGIAGYGLTLEGDGERPVGRLHGLGRYLKHAGVTSIFVDETSNITGEFRATDRNLSYLADNIVFLRHLELRGELRKAIGVLEKRTSDFERTLRTFEMSEHGLKVGEPLRDLQGVLSGMPRVVEGDREGTRGGA